MIRIALVGQPNCGKSTLFNSVAGYKAMVSNYPGTTVQYAVSQVSMDGEGFELMDLPGIYSLSSVDTEELITRNHLLKNKPDALINIIDSSVLSRSLELTIELLDLEIPLVICLNMIDEAERKGIQIDVEHLANDLGVRVVPTVSTRGLGIPELFHASVAAAKNTELGKTFPLSLDVETVVSEVAALVEEETAQSLGMPARFLALKLLEQDANLEGAIKKLKPEIIAEVERLRRGISACHGRPSDVVISSERHSLVMNLFEHVAKVKPRAGKAKRDRADTYVMAPYLGYLILGLILFTFFGLVFGFGKFIEEPLLGWFEQLSAFSGTYLDRKSIFFSIANGLIQGFSGGIGIVLPYLIPFLFGLSLLEDIGYLPRAAFLMDSIMHRIGLHGKSVIPFVLGYGCNVPAIMGVRILEKPRDRFITSVLVTFIPCAARTTIIFALIAFYLGPVYALLLYLFNLVVIAAAGKLLCRMMPEVSPGLILEIPSYRLPNLRAVAHKIWFRLREFVVIAWPLLILGSLVLSLLEYFHLSEPINRVLSPFTSGLLGLPSGVSIVLIFGILRKELTIIMLVQALGTSNFASVMTTEQMLVFALFTLFYIPCLATLGMLRSMIGGRGMIFTLVFTTGVGTFVALLFRAVFWLL
jgi:ferrous iron transport protein B